MNRVVVVDTSLAIKWVLKENYSPESLALLDEWRAQPTRMLAPTLLAFEATNVIYRRVGRGGLTLEDARHRLAELLSRAPELVHEPALHARAQELAHELGQPACYDAHYLALAEREGCEFWTADERLWNAVRARLTWVRWIGEYRLQPAPQSHPGT
ncbi:MAG: type II toxin-antitoxin system VapC family toxin [Chloroflexota bacterium]